jgi:hypothetical protein
MKRVTRLFLVLLALTAANLPAAPHKGGSRVQSKAGGYWFYCYDSPGDIWDCDGSACGCRDACAQECGGPCDWDDTCPN